jgi:hypothetical protein
MYGSAQRRLESAGNTVAELRRALSEKLPAPASESLPPLPTQLSCIDAALSGGLPRGKVTEIVGGAGKMAFALLSLAAATQRGELCAFVDTGDALDIKTAARIGVVLERLLWVRTSAGTGTVEQRDLKAVDLLLSAGGFALIVMYVSGRAAKTGALRIGSVWPRLIQRCEKAKAALLIASEEPLAGSFAAATLRCAPGEAVWEQAPGGRLILHGRRAEIEVVRNRLGPPGEIEALPLRK